MSSCNELACLWCGSIFIFLTVVASVQTYPQNKMQFNLHKLRHSGGHLDLKDKLSMHRKLNMRSPYLSSSNRHSINERPGLGSHATYTKSQEMTNHVNEAIQEFDSEQMLKLKKLIDEFASDVRKQYERKEKEPIVDSVIQRKINEAIAKENYTFIRQVFRQFNDRPVIQGGLRRVSSKITYKSASDEQTSSSRASQNSGNINSWVDINFERQREYYEQSCSPRDEFVCLQDFVNEFYGSEELRNKYQLYYPKLLRVSLCNRGRCICQNDHEECQPVNITMEKIQTIRGNNSQNSFEMDPNNSKQFPVYIYNHNKCECKKKCPRNATCPTLFRYTHHGEDNCSCECDVKDLSESQAKERRELCDKYLKGEKPHMDRCLLDGTCHSLKCKYGEMSTLHKLLRRCPSINEYAN